MKANSSPMSVADYCQDLKSNKIVVNQDYQRKEGLWNNPARSFFIESILLEYPIPKIFLYAKLDLATRQTVKEIVDGQQRSQALLSFFDNRLTLAKTLETEEVRGLKYSTLPDEWKTKFLAYSLPIDQFSGVPEDEVREAFRRMNANNVPLNAEEQRNARYQGPFKWFMVSVAERYKDTLLRVGLFSRRDLIRMSDLKLYAELALTLDGGFVTTKGAQLDRLYRKYNTSFPNQEEFFERIVFGVDQVLAEPLFHDQVVLRMHIFQSLVLALIGRRFDGAFVDQAKVSRRELSDRLELEPVPFDTLVSCLREPEAYPQLADFTKATSGATNTAEARQIRFLYFYNSI